MGARLSKSLNRFTAYSSYPFELKLGRMIPDIISHNRSELDFRSEGAVKARLLIYVNRFTTYSINQIELNLGRMILDISPRIMPCRIFRFT